MRSVEITKLNTDFDSSFQGGKRRSNFFSDFRNCFVIWISMEILEEETGSENDHA